MDACNTRGITCLTDRESCCKTCQVYRNLAGFAAFALDMDSHTWFWLRIRVWVSVSRKICILNLTFQAKLSSVTPNLRCLLQRHISVSSPPGNVCAHHHGSMHPRAAGLLVTASLGYANHRHLCPGGSIVPTISKHINTLLQLSI